MGKTNKLADEQISEITALVNDKSIDIDSRANTLLARINEGKLEPDALLTAFEAYKVMTYKQGDATDLIEEESLEY